MQVEINKQVYRTTGRIDARRQFHIGLKIGPALSALLASRARAALALPPAPKDGEKDDANEADVAVALSDVFQAVATALASMPEADVNYILNSCLHVVERQDGEKWAKVLRPGGTEMMYQDMDFPVMLRLCKEVIQENLGNFFSQPLAFME